MAATLASNLDLTLRGTYANVLDLLTASANFSVGKSDEMSNGTGAVDTSDLLFTDTRTLATTSESLDLAGGLTDSFGNALTFARVKCLLIHNKSTTVGQTVTIGGAASNQFLLFADATDKYVLGPNGIFLFWEPSAAGKVVTASTGDLLKIETSASISYDIVIIGSSA